MIATQIFISMVVLISSIHFITCAAITGGSATKPVISNFAVINNKPDTTSDMLYEGETDQSNFGLTSVPTKVRNVMNKSVSFLLWPVKKSWKIIKSFMPVRRNMNIVTRNMVNGEIIN